MLKILIIFLLLDFFACCSQHKIETTQVQTNIQINSESQIVKTEIDKSSEKIPKPLQIPADVKEFGWFALTRVSDKKDKNGWMTPPFKSAQIKMHFEIEPRIGEKATVVPLEVKLEPFQLAISKVTKTKYSGCFEISGCFENDGKESFWSIELETITNKEILEMQPVRKHRDQMPFSVFVIYPAVEFAKSLTTSSLTKEMLPENITSRRVEAAIDIDNDNKPDLISVGFCCGDPNKESDENCPYICQKYFKRINRTWIITRYTDLRM